MLEWITKDTPHGRRASAAWRGLACLVTQHEGYAAWSINTYDDTLASGRRPDIEQAMAEVERRLWLLTHGDTAEGKDI